MPVSALMAGSRMLTADVFALTTSVDRQVTINTPRAARLASVPVISVPFADDAASSESRWLVVPGGWHVVVPAPEDVVGPLQAAREIRVMLVIGLRPIRARLPDMGGVLGSQEGLAEKLRLVGTGADAQHLLLAGVP